MYKSLFIMLVAAVFMFGAGNVSAKVDYSAKKSGKVHFQDQEQEQDAQTAAEAEIDPSQIEPAAGAIEEEAEDLGESMKLPRK